MCGKGYIKEIFDTIILSKQLIRPPNTNSSYSAFVSKDIPNLPDLAKDQKRENERIFAAHLTTSLFFCDVVREEIYIKTIVRQQ